MLNELEFDLMWSVAGWKQVYASAAVKTVTAVMDLHLMKSTWKKIHRSLGWNDWCDVTREGKSDEDRNDCKNGTTFCIRFIKGQEKQGRRYHVHEYPIVHPCQMETEILGLYRWKALILTERDTWPEFVYPWFWPSGVLERNILILHLSDWHTRTYAWFFIIFNFFSKSTTLFQQNKWQQWSKHRFPDDNYWRKQLKKLLISL